MVMDTIQVRLAHGIVQKIDELVATGMYASRSDVLRDAVRRLVLDTITGVIENKDDSVSEIRKARRQLSKEKINLSEINSFAE